MTDIEDLAEKLFILAATARDPELYWESIESIAIWSFHAAEAFTRFKNSRLDDAGGADREEKS